MTYNIVCDSSCDLKSTELQPGYLHLEVVPMQITVGDREYLDNESLNVPLLLEDMATEKSSAGTACPSPAAFARAFEKADCSVCFTISSNLSGTYNAAVLARDMVLEEHPEKKICVIDSRSTAGAMVLLTRKAQSLLEVEDPDFDKVCEELRMYQASLRTVFTLECFDNLIKNGRMRPLVGNLLHTLGIHVIADATPQGTIHVSGKARGEAKTYQAIVDLMRQSKDCDGAEVVLSHCENLPGALKLKELILRELPVKDVTLVSCRGLTTFYAMEKGLIVGF
ncbi:DegV family protein [Dysosmobacter sp. HCP28S3_G4]|uniref:DegV family protein n=1 Tax=Dysosmobacter sp. HCP28S3_G4 TaxID=3438938 RepID=UPI003EFBD064